MRQWVRTILLGRPDGIRAELRRRTGVLSWLDDPGAVPWLEDPEPSPPGWESGPGASDVGRQPPAAQPASGWVRVIDAADVPAGSLAEVFVGGKALVIANVDGALHAIDSVCPHAGGPLADGHLEGCMLTCPWHGWSYDVRDGRSVVSDEVHLDTFPVRVEAGGILVEV